MNKYSNLIFVFSCLLLCSAYSFGESCEDVKFENQENKYETVIAGGLMWMKLDYSAFHGRYVASWHEAISWANEINSSGKSEYNNWRLPTIKEYRKINKSSSDRVEYRKKFVELKRCEFWGIGPHAFWSINEIGKYLASYISFVDGTATSGSKEGILSNPYSEYKGKPFGLSVRLVRDIK